MKSEQVTCDGCGADLTTRTNSVDYRLILASESKPGYGPGCYTDMMIYPAIKRAHHFCRLDCLDLWRDREWYEASLWCEWWSKWKEERGTKHEGGMTSYPEPSQETRNACKEEFAAVALAAFPMERKR